MPSLPANSLESNPVYQHVEGYGAEDLVHPNPKVARRRIHSTDELNLSSYCGKDQSVSLDLTNWRVDSLDQEASTHC